MTETDIVIIGAGAAGVGAGLAAQDAGVSCLILEAAPRMGGRAFTDKVSMRLPWDQGCHWLHCADVNPLVPWADRTGAAYLRQKREGARRYWQGGRWLDPARAAACVADIETAFDVVYDASCDGRDVPVSDVLPDFGSNTGFVRQILQLMSSADPEDESTSASGDYDDTEVNWPVVTGYGDLIERMSAGLPIRLDTPVQAIAEVPNGVAVDTSAGTIRAQAAIVTVSTSVLAAGAIRITSPDATPVLDLAAKMPCGSYEKVAIDLRRPLPGLDDALFFSVEPDGRVPVNVQILDWSDRMVITHVGGSVAREASQDGPDGLRAFSLERMVAAFGADIKKEIAAMEPTGWQDNLLVRGAYSAVAPGHAQARRDLIGLHTGRVGFAGEAFSLPWQATAHGAYLSGQDVARRVIAQELVQTL